jgi:heme-degrading monooxygenase HmoA
MSVSMLIRHKVRDFDEWQRVHAESRELERDHGVRGVAILRSMDDPQQVTVAYRFDSTEAARAFFDLSEVRQVMERAGVDRTTIAEEYLEDVETGDLGRAMTKRRTTRSLRSPMLFVRQRVADFDAWKRAYDERLADLGERGIRRHRVLRSLTDPNVVVTASTFGSLRDARDFVAAAEHRQALLDAGAEPASIHVETYEEVPGPSTSARSP